jgi:8-oxo-dGTP diphosphatase
MDNQQGKLTRQGYPVGVAVRIHKGTKVLMLKRKNCETGNGKWAYPGGCAEVGETIDEAAARELKEEIGMDVNPTCLYEEVEWAQRVGDTGEPYIMFYFDFHPNQKQLEQIQNMEPDKCEELKWFYEYRLPAGRLE